MNKIKVCHIITKLELGGAQRNTLHTTANLDRSRFQVSLIAGTGGILDDEARSLNDVKTCFINNLVRQISPVKDFLALISIYNILKTEKPDIVHTHSSKAGILGRIAAKLAGIPVIVHTYHGFGFNDFQNSITRSVYVMAERLTGPITTHFIVVAKEDLHKGLKHGIGSENRYSVIRSGIDISRYSSNAVDRQSIRNKLGIKKDEKIITTIGPFKPQKNLSDFVKVCAIILKDTPQARFFVVGDGEQRAILEKLIEASGLADRLTLLGWRKDIPEILSVTDVFAMTSLWEGLPRSILEAMSSGLPVVANAVDGVKEIVKEGENGYLIEPGDIKSFAARLTHIFSNPEQAAKMGTNGRLSIGREYDINYMVRQQEELYLKLRGLN